MNRIFAKLLILTLFWSNAGYSYEIVDKDFPSPFTGVLLNEAEVTDYMTLTHDKKTYEFQINTLNQELDYKTKELKECKTHYKMLMLYQTGSMMFGITITVVLVYVLQNH